MKIKRIKHDKDIKAGNYIRAYVSPSGWLCIDYIRLIGKPFTLKNGINKGSFLIKAGFNKTASYSPVHWYFSTLSNDLGNYPNKKHKQVVTNVLFKYTPAVYKYLHEIKARANLHEYLNAINSRSLTDIEFQKETDAIHEYNMYASYSYRIKNDPHQNA